MKKKPFNENILYGILVVVIVLSVLNAYLIGARSQQISNAVVDAKENARPANIEVVVLTAECQECIGIDEALEILKGRNVNITKEEMIDFSSDEGKLLVTTLGISKLPTLIVSGETDKPSIENIWSGWEERRSKMVLTDLSPPYFSPSSGVVGKVSVVNIIDSSCEKCVSLSQVVDFLETNGVFISSEKNIEYSSAEAKEMINSFGISRVPAIILSDNILEYSAVAEVWPQVGAVEKDGSFSLHAQVPPYRDIETGEIKGLVDLVYLDDVSCSSCYDVNVNKNILAGLGIFPVSESHIDVSSAEGSALVKKYKIEKVPVILVSPEGNEYPPFVQVWPQVGSVELDNWYVMRNPELLGIYKNLSSGEEIDPRGS